VNKLVIEGPEAAPELHPDHEHITQHRRAKIVCTMGPATNSEAIIRDLLQAGMDVARLNFSHGTYPEHQKRIEMLRRAAQKADRTICILQDLQGPKIRTGRLKYRTPVALKAGSRVTITPKDIPGTTTIISTTFQTLAHEVKTGDRILLSDGLIELRVHAIHGSDVECEVINGGMLGEHKGINLPGIVLSVPSMTAKDEEDLAFGIKQGVDSDAQDSVGFCRSRTIGRATAGGSWQRLRNGDDFRVGFFRAPLPPFYQLGAEVAQVSDGSAERCAPEAEKDAQFAQAFFELIAHSRTAT